MKMRKQKRVYLAHGCQPPNPLVRVRDPFGKLLFRAKSSVVSGEGEIFHAAEVDE